MKRIKRLIILFIFSFIFFPCITNAATELSASTQKPVVGSTLYVQLEANYGKKNKIKDFHVCVEYDHTYFELVKVIWVKSSLEIGTYKTEQGRIYVDKKDGNWLSGPVLQMQFKVLKEGTSKINVVETQPATYTNGDKIAQTMAGILINSIQPSTNTLLGKLYVKGYNIYPSFRATEQEYNLKVPADVKEIEIIAKKSDVNQTVTGGGKKELRYGPNKFKIVVTAQNNDTRTYVILITRVDDRSGDLSLKTLHVSGTNIKVENGKKIYDATVSRSVDSVLIAARTNDPLATLTGTGKKNLKIGLNTFEIFVKSASGLTKTYTINITRSTEEIKEPVLSSKLKQLKVNGLVLNLSNENKIFTYGVSHKIKQLSIEAITESETAIVEITGNEKLKTGINKIDIKVTQVLNEEKNASDNNSIVEPKVEETTYNLLVYKYPDNTKEISSIDDIDGLNNYIFSTTSNDPKIISKEKIKLLVNNKRNFYYNIVNTYNGLLYQVKLPAEMEISNVDLSFTKNITSDITYITNLPTNSELTIYLEQKYPIGSDVQIYSYSESGGYKQITAGVEVKDGYVTFLTNGDSNYIITTRNLLQLENNIDKIISIAKKAALYGGIGLIVIFIISKMKKNKNNTKKEEPLY